MSGDASNTANARWLEQHDQDILAAAVHRGLLVFVLVLVPTVVVSASRGLLTGWLPIYTGHIAFAVLLLGVLLLRHRISVRFEGGLIIFVCFVAVLAGLYSFGLMAAAPVWFASVAIYMIGMLYPGRSRVALVGLLIAGMCWAAAGHLSGSFWPLMAPAAFIRSGANWILYVILACFYVAVVLPTVAAYSRSMTALLHEVTAQRDQIARLSELDALTGLPMLLTARDRLAIACNRARRSRGMAAVMFVDLDGFKAVNDGFGHEAGDHCLVEVATRLRRALRDEDTAARIGGDEFIVVIDSVAGRSEAARTAQRLIEAVAPSIEWQGQALQLGASIGIALYPEHGDNARTLQGSADAAMYAIKRAGKNAYGFAMEPARLAPAIDTGLRHTVERNARGDALRGDPTLSGPLTGLVDRCVVTIAFWFAAVSTLDRWRSLGQASSAVAFGTELLFVTLIVLALLRHRMSLRAKTFVVGGFLLLVQLSGLLWAGLAAGGATWPVTLLLFLAGILFSRRAFIAVAAAVPVGIALIGTGFARGWLSPHVDPARYVAHPASWGVYIVSAVAFACVVLPAWADYRRVVTDLILQAQEQTREIARLAMQDTLTGLPLASVARDRVTMACRRAANAHGRAAVLFVDLDGFKSVNDTYGHEAGDHCLRQVAQRLAGALRAVDTTARIGGDEFLVVLEDIGAAAGAAAAARKLVDAVVPPIDYGGHSLQVGASIGIALFPDDGTEFDTLCRASDAAMYAVKRAGKSGFGFSAAQQMQSASRAS